MAVLGTSIKSSGIFSNFPQVKQALDAYVKVRNQSTYTSVLEKMQGIAYKAAGNTAFSERSKIASSIANLPNKGDVKPRSGGTQYVGQYKVINWERKIKGLPTLGGSGRRKILVNRPNPRNPGGWTIEEATKRNKSRGAGLGVSYFMDGKYKGFIKSRQQGSKWLRIGWALAADMLGKPFGRGDFGPATKARLSGEKYGGGASIKINGAGKFDFEIFNGVGVFDHRYRPPGRVADFSGKLPLRPSADVARARAIQEAGLMKGIQAEIASMAKLIISRTGKIWGGQAVPLKNIKPL
jgi:hypothetical protein